MSVNLIHNLIAMLLLAFFIDKFGGLIEKEDYQIWLEAIPRGIIESKVVSPCRWPKANIWYLIRRGFEGPVEAEHKCSSSSCDESQVTQTGAVTLEGCSHLVKILLETYF